MCCGYDDRHGDLVTDRIGHPDDRHVGDPGMRGEDLFDLDHRNVLAGDLEHVRVTPVEDEPTLLVAGARSPVRNHPSLNDAAVVAGSSR